MAKRITASNTARAKSTALLHRPLGFACWHVRGASGTRRVLTRLCKRSARIALQCGIFEARKNCQSFTARRVFYGVVMLNVEQTKGIRPLKVFTAVSG